MTVFARDDLGWPIAAIYPGTTQKITSTNPTPTQSNVFQTTTKVIRVIASAAGTIAIGQNPTAGANDTALAANVAEYFAVSPGGGSQGPDRLSFLATSGTATLQITEGGNFK